MNKAFLSGFLSGLKEGLADIFNWVWPVFAVMGLTAGIADFHSFGTFILMIGISCDYVCHHPDVQWRMIGRNDKQPQWCPLTQEKSL